jgi:multiple sugar transport system substrate-binding protein
MDDQISSNNLNNINNSPAKNPTPPLNDLAESSPKTPPSPIVPTQPTPTPPPPPSSLPPESPPPPPPEKSGLPLKKITLAIAGVVVLASLFFLVKGKLFQKKPSSTKEAITLTYWGLWEPKPVMQGLIEQFEKDHPNIKINYIMQSPKDYRSRIQSRIAKNTGPDIFRLHHSWIPMLTNDLSPVPEEVKNNLKLEKDYFPIIGQTLKRNGRFYAVPLMIDTLALYYNKDILSAADKQPPRTWWGLKKLAEELTVVQQGKIQTAGAALGTTNNVDHWSDILGLMIFQNDGHPGSPKQKAVQDSLRFYTLFAQGENHVWDKTLPHSTLSFANGKLAFYFAPSWRYFEIKQINPNLNFAITTVPQLPKLADVDLDEAEKGKAELTNTAWATFWVEGVSSKSSHQKEAWEFLQFLASQESLQKLYSGEKQIREFGEIYPVVSLAESLKNDPLIRPFVQQAPNAVSWYMNSFTHDGGLNDSIIKYYEDAINAINSGESIDSVVETLSAGINQVLNRYQIPNSPN